MASKTFDKLFLCNDSYVCSAQEYWIVLNTRRDEYLCVTQQDIDVIAPWLHGWNHSRSAERLPEESATATLLQSLVQREVLTGNRLEGKIFAKSEYEAPTGAISEDDNPGNRVSPGGLWSFLRAAAVADWKLRVQPIAKTIRQVEERRLRRSSSTAPTDIEAAQTVLQAFWSFRALYPRRYLCLFDSLALLEFLASAQIFPNWVFGVMANPFAAHCWVQAGCIVLNDDLEQVSGYTPIMVK
ncbi:MAG: lasso peptide biosynthesis B2 protein [Steroidobacteraceae bacterium]